MHDLFGHIAPLDPPKETMAEGAVLLRGAALPFEKEVLAALNEITAISPFRHMVTPGGFTMSVAMTNCGAAGWVTDRTGYRYDGVDPETGNPWPPMPGCFLDLAAAAAAEAGYPKFRPDACLINRYQPGARLSLHQDKNERDFANPIASVSLGLPATFQFGGLKRNDPVKKFALRHGDVAVWGGPSRLCYHGVSELKIKYDLTGRRREATAQHPTRRTDAAASPRSEWLARVRAVASARRRHLRSGGRVHQKGGKVPCLRRRETSSSNTPRR